MSPKRRKNSQYIPYILVDTRIGLISIKRIYRRVKCVVALTKNTNKTLHKRRAPVTTTGCVRAKLCGLNLFQRNHNVLRSSVTVMICICCANNDFFLLQSCDRRTVCFTKVLLLRQYRLLCRCVTMYGLPDCNA